MTIPNLECTGVSGDKYLYYPALPGSKWLEQPGNYIFCKWTGEAWIVQYIGECERFSDRMLNHDRWQEGVRDYGVTTAFSHITTGGVAARQREEQDLIRAYNPPMNVHHRTNTPGALNALATANRLAGISPLGRSLLNGKR